MITSIGSQSNTLRRQRSGGLVTIGLTACLYIVLSYLYLYYINPTFALYHVYVSEWKWAVGLAVSLLVSVVIHMCASDITKPSRVPLYLIFLGLIVPILVLYGLRDGPTNFVLVATGLYTCMVVILNGSRIFMVPRLDKTALYLILIGLAVLSVYVVAALIATGGIQRVNFDLGDVYETRTDYQQRARFPFGGYVVPWQAYVVNSLLLCLGLYQRKKVLVASIILLQLGLFAMTNFKSFLFAPVLVIGLYLLSEKRGLIKYMIAGGVTVLAFSYIWFLASGDHLWSSIIIRRLFFVPAHNHLLYFDWFAHNPKVMMSNSLLSPFIDNPYHERITRVISWEYHGRDGGPNVGYLGDAYAHFGFYGMAVYTLVLTGILKFVDVVGEMLPTRVVVPVVGITFMALLNSALPTVMVTHGALLMIVCLWAFAGRLEGRTSRRFKKPGAVLVQGAPRF